MDKHDSAFDSFQVSFYEVTPDVVARQLHSQEDEFLDTDFDVRFSQPEIHDKWLYLFYSKGSDYAVRRSSPTGTHNGDFDGRALHPEETGGQLLAMPRLEKFADDKEIIANAITSRTFAPVERADAAKFELHFTRGSFVWQDIETGSRWKHSIFKRRRPREKTRSTTFALPLVIDGEPVRWYFILSSIRLGPAALNAATQRCAADGLSIKHTAPANRSEDVSAERRRGWEKIQNIGRFVTPDDLRIWREMINAGEDHPRRIKAAASRIGVADPYHFAARLNDELYSLALDKFMRVMDTLPANKDMWYSKFLLDPKIDLGNLNDLYAMSELLLPVMKGQEMPWRVKTARSVIRYVKSTIQHLENRCEAEAMRLTSWLLGPAHRIIDIGATIDTAAPKNRRDVMVAAEARAYALAHWYNVTSRLGLTQSGARFIAGMLAESVGDADDDRRRLPRSDSAGDAGPKPKNYNPIKLILHPYRAGKLKKDSVDYHTVGLARHVVPDLIVTTGLCDMHDGSEPVTGVHAALRMKKGNVVAQINNLTLLPFKLSADPKEAPDSAYKKPKTWFSRGLWTVKTADKVANDIMTTYRKKVTGDAIEKAFNWHDSKNPAPIGLRVEEEFKPKPDGSGSGLKASTAVLAWMNVIFGQASDIRTLQSENASSAKKLKTGIKMGTNLAGAFVQTAGALDLKLDTFEAILAMPDDFDSSWGRLKGTVTISMSVTAMVTSVWSIYAGVDSASTAFSQGDSSVAIGHGIGVFTGAVSSVAGLMGWSSALAVTTPAGFVLFVIMLVGLYLVAFTKDKWLEKFVDHSFFSGLDESRNKWIGGDKQSFPFAGRQHAIADDRWPVAHQRVALFNHLARFNIRSQASVEMDEEHNKVWLNDVSVTLGWNLLPPGSTFVLVFGYLEDLPNFMDDPQHHWMTLTPSGAGVTGTEFLRGIGGLGSDEVSARFGRDDAPADGFPFRASMDVNSPVFGVHINISLSLNDVDRMPWGVGVRFKHAGGTWTTLHKIVEHQSRSGNILQNIDATLPSPDDFAATHEMPATGLGWKLAS